MLGDKGGCLFASLDVVFGQQLLKIGQKLVFCPFLEAGSNLSRWQRKQVIWKKNLSYSDEWGRQCRGRDSCSLLELLFNFFLCLGSNGGVTHGDLQMIISWQAKDHPTQAYYSSAHITQFNSALQQSPEQCEGWSVRFRLVRIMFRDSNIRFV